MNWGQAAFAAGAGLASLAVFVGGGLLAVRLVATQFVLFPFGDSPDIGLPAVIAGILTLAAAAMGALALPSLALGAGWPRSLAAAGLAVIVFLILVVLVALPTPGKVVLTLFALVATPTLLVWVAVLGVAPEAARSLLLVVFVAAVIYAAAVVLTIILFPTTIPGFIVTLLAWPLLPALAALLRPA